ncbi:phospholipase A1 member A-like [Leguminivora glycinivorella]|uniref:phospholipase A1 member A-like n=1 Tax=Leguminivora glycinivorella TaxID=1035111 RepID=UPI00200D153E|nr:phospholipase A1 member A-like [Leguminivora glycinivorella]
MLAVAFILFVLQYIAAEQMIQPMGFLSDCPGSSKPADIKPKSLKKLTMSVLGTGSLFEANWTSYNYYKIKYLPDHPEIDFKNKKTLLYVPGYLDNIDAPVGRGFGQQYKERGYNVIILESFTWTTDLWPVSARLLRPVGKYAAQMLATLTTLGLNPKDLELLGVSLGGQTMSFIAKNYRNITGQTIAKLVAVEPTGPCFRNLGPDERIDISDGDFVLHIASNIYGFGMTYPVGHVAFYVNGGEWQQSHIWYAPCGIICSHIRALLVWISALNNPGKFIGVQCDSVEKAVRGDCFDKKDKVTNALDIFTDNSKPGIYFLPTRNSYPFYLANKGVEFSSGFEYINNFLERVNKEDMMLV